MSAVVAVRSLAPRLICSSILFFFLYGCASRPNVQLMIPLCKTMRHDVIERTVWVAEVKGEVDQEELIPRYPGDSLRGHRMDLHFYAKNEQVREVLVKSLSQAGIFRAVGTDHESDLELKANIVSQHFKGPNSLNTRNEIIIIYNLVEKKSGNVIWHATIQSESGSSALAGAKRFSEACEGAVRENVVLFLQEISKKFDSGSRESSVRK